MVRDDAAVEQYSTAVVTTKASRALARGGGGSFVSRVILEPLGQGKVLPRPLLLASGGKE